MSKFTKWLLKYSIEISWCLVGWCSALAIEDLINGRYWFALWMSSVAVWNYSIWRTFVRPRKIME